MQYKYDENRDKIKRGETGWYLYHHYKNEAPIIPLILLSCFFMICDGGVLMILITWVIYGIWAYSNNRQLDSDPEVLEQRRILAEVMKKYF